MKSLARLRSWAASVPTLLRGFDIASLAHTAVAIARGRAGVVVLRGGPSFRVRTLLDVWVVKETCLDGVYDSAAHGLPEDAVVVDVGAGLGDFAVHAARQRPRGRVVALEPHPGSFAFLEENLARNAVANVLARPWAVTGESGPTARLDVSAKEPVLFSTAAGDGTRAVEVPSRTLASVLDELALPRVDLLKLDCEGAEFGILLGASDETLRVVARIVLEYHEGVTAFGATDLERRLREAGYTVRTSRSIAVPSTGILEARRA